MGIGLHQFAGALRLTRPTVRLRLTALYGALFLLSGVGLVAITYALMSQAPECTAVLSPEGTLVDACGSSGDPTLLSEGSAQSITGSQQNPVNQPNELDTLQLDELTDQLEGHATVQRNAQLDQLLVRSGIALGVMAVVAVGLGWVVAGRVLDPLRTITATARRISATNLHQRVALEGPDDELKELGDTFDGLLDRLEDSFDAQRRFVANASHELRTPLARQRTVAQVALADPTANADTLRAAHMQILAAGEQQERLIDALLTLARGQAGVERQVPCDLASLTADALVSRRPQAKQRGLDLRETLEPAPTIGGQHLIERLVANLVDNAITHNVAEGYVEVGTGMRAGHAVLTVANSGPHVPAEEIDRLLQPFQRLGAERVGHGPGLGLGLSIVQAIADTHHADLDIHPLPRGGLKVEVIFPSRAVPDAHDNPE